MCLTSCTVDTQCSGTALYCNGSTSTPGSCVSKKANGATCAAAKECVSANCTDGVCCTTSSCGTCQSCSASGNGTCANVADNSADPHSRCPVSTGCGNTGVCVSGACQQQPASTACGAAQSCSNGIYQPPSYCSGTGTCSQTVTTSCGNYICGGTTCRSNCTADSDCANSSLYCTGNASTPGSCVSKLANGQACSAGNQCSSGSCTDGVCCTTGSCAACQMCNLNGAGTCSAVGVSTPALDPYGRCSNTGSCGNTGLCANGSCQQQAITTPCGPSVSCASGLYQPQSFCNGAGNCSTMSPISCGAYVCNGPGTACLTSCNYNANGDAECASGHYCNGGPNGTCQPKKVPGSGNTCSLGHECTSGSCVDGFCCNASACGTCQTCSSGACGNVANGAVEPHGLCLASPPCGNTGTCTGGACTQGAAGTICVGAFCQNATTFQPDAKCDGAGSCSIPPTQNCSPNTCGGAGGCRPGCANDTECAGGTYCNAGTCSTPQGLGATCGRNAECGSGNCTEGFCCNVGTCPSCQTCALPLAQGTCQNVLAGGADPTLTCQDQGPASCGTTGLCNGAGNCARYDISTECMTSCDFTTTTATHTFCDGAGQCAGASLLEPCLSLMCTAANAGCAP